MYIGSLKIFQSKVQYANLIWVDPTISIKVCQSQSLWSKVYRKPRHLFCRWTKKRIEHRAGDCPGCLSWRWSGGAAQSTAKYVIHVVATSPVQGTAACPALAALGTATITRAARRDSTPRFYAASTSTCTCMRRSPTICHVHLLGKYWNISYSIYYVIMSLFITYSRNGPCRTWMWSCFLNISPYNLYHSVGLLFGINLPNDEQLVSCAVTWDAGRDWELLINQAAYSNYYNLCGCGSVGRAELNGLLFRHRLSCLGLHVGLIPSTVWRLRLVIIKRCQTFVTNYLLVHNNVANRDNCLLTWLARF